MTVITRPIARAMSAQLERVNHNPERLAERIAELEAENARLRAALDLRRQVADSFGTPYRASAGDEVSLRQLYAARFRGQCAYSTLVRYCQSGYWRAYQDAGRRWHVYPDQSLHLKPKGRKIR
jgi:hypothetical protein